MADAGRVIAGTARGLRLSAPGPGTRPLADRVKQTLFAILEPDLPGARVLDLYAGSGAAGIEALSRGAELVVFVERDGGAIRAIEANLRSTQLAGSRAVVVRGDARRFLDESPRSPDARIAEPFDVVIVDPPYADEDGLRDALTRLGDNEPVRVADEGRVVAKHFWRTALPARIGLLASERERRFGETALTFYRRRPQAPDPEDA